VAQQFLKKIPPGNRVYQTRVRVLKSSFPIFISSYASLTLILPHPHPHASLTLSLPHASVKPPSRPRLHQASLTPPSASRHASLSVTSRLTPGDFKSTMLLLSLSSLGCAKGRQLSLSLVRGVQGKKNLTVLLLSLW
jgi:hypothetical protein